MISITKVELEALRPCDLQSRLALFGRKSKMTVKDALKAGVSIEDILWVAARTGHVYKCVQFSLHCAQRVANLNPDPRVQAAIDAGQRVVDLQGTPEEGAAGDAAWAAGDAAGAAGDAAGAARPLVGAAWAAWAAARAAAWAAGDAAGAARAAAWAAGDAAGAARPLVGAAETEAQKEILLKVFG